MRKIKKRVAGKPILLLTIKLYLPPIKKLTTGVVFGLLVGFLIFVIININASQQISPLYFRLIKEDKNSTITFLSTISHLPVFPYFLRINQSIFGESLVNDITSEKKTIRNQIKILEQALKSNPSARDVLIQLSRLYYKLEDKSSAEHYLQRAWSVDPEIKKNTHQP